MRLVPGLICALAATAAADVELKNDSFTDGGQIAFQGGFVTGEIGAAQFIAPDAGRQLVKLQLLFGEPGANGDTESVTVIVYDDTADALIPGDVLYRGDYQLTSSMSALHELVISDEVVTLPAKFRVGIQVVHDGSPSIAADTDQSQSGKNFIFAVSPQGDQWVPSSLAGVKGDWVIRACVSGTGNPMGGACTTNPDCPPGEFCDTAAGTCTFECVTDPDCGEGTCNSLGQCVGGGDDGGGCCGTSRDPELAALFGAGLLGLLLRRRRCAG